MPRLPSLLRLPSPATAEALFHGHFVDGPLRPIGRVAFGAMLSLELSAFRTLDSLSPRVTAEPNAVTNDLTAVIKTFERPAALKRLLASIQRLYPGLRVIVADDSRHPLVSDRVQVIAMPYYSGISMGRNEALRHVTTKYVLFLDDDFVFYRKTNLAGAVAMMQANPEIDIMGGEVLNLPFFTTIDYFRAVLFPSERLATMRPGSLVGGLPVYDKVANFFIGRSERISVVGWDPRLRKVEHADFFTRAKGVLTTVFNRRLRCLHAPTPFDAAYMRLRNDYGVEGKLLQKRYYGDHESP